MTKVSVILPVYNVGNYLNDSLNLLLNQTLNDIEIICVNDGSTDNSLLILEDFSLKDSRIKIINQENMGAGIARNNGMNIAQGEYIYFIDADDIVTIDILEKLYYNAINNDSDFVLFKVAKFNEKEINYNSPIYDLEKIFPGADFNNFIFSALDIKQNVLNVAFAPWTKFYKREFLEKNKLEFPDIYSYNDILFHVKSMLMSSKISFVPEFLYFYRLDNPDSITNDPKKHYNIFSVIKSVEDFLIKEDFMEFYKNEFELFKLIQISRHMVFPVSEKYFYEAKMEFLKLDVSDNPLITKKDLEKYDVCLNLSVDQIDKFEDYLELLNLQNKNKNLERSIKRLNKSYTKQKDIQDNILSSNSWKFTKPLRSIRNSSLKEFLLNRSNSYVYYKLKNSNKTLKKRNKRLENVYEKMYIEKNHLISEKDSLSKENNLILKEIKHLISEKGVLNKEKNRIMDDLICLAEENDDLTKILRDVLNFTEKNVEKPKVSVVIPVYNVEKYLVECMDSVINQTFKDIEIICVNDGSTDDSLAILEYYAKLDDRIKIITQENRGLGNARNVGMRHASGDYLVFIDSDDYISLDTIAKLYNNSLSNGSDIVIFKIARFDNEGNVNYKLPGFDFDDFFEEVDFNNFSFTYSDIKKYVMNASFSACLKFYKKEIFDKQDDLIFPEGIAYEDVPFHIKIMLYANKISFVPEFLYYYRFNPNSIINTSSNGDDIFIICDMVESFLRKNYYYAEFKEEFELFKISQIFNYLLTTNTEDYFLMAKKEFSEMSIEKNNLIPKSLKKKYDLVLKSQTLKQYQTN
ncbi:MAG: glycosyltransferase [Methanobrevibacter ruminantium]|uniref:glycosyltransferase n=1 Tax=Methanobrevibacter ruminantium TaxID=83816 RepID=UPI0026EB1891|nr:glycosyltransferase family 2 protein [Methanobrevibacter ruminantium]MDO5841812.1 glycosyltransferase [Methanobrevibacter ruminantium]